MKDTDLSCMGHKLFKLLVIPPPLGLIEFFLKLKRTQKFRPVLKHKIIILCSYLLNKLSDEVWEVCTKLKHSICGLSIPQNVCTP